MEEKISVIMGVYNCSDTLKESLDSIVRQTYTNWELVICDDGSTDDTYAVLLEYKRRYPDKIILLRNNINSKLAYSLNRCLEYTTGQFIARMDGDDISLPDRFEKQLGFLKNNPDIDLVGTSMRRFNEDGLADVIEAIQNPDRFTLKDSIPFFHATIMTYKHVYDALGGYTVSQRTVRVEDYDLWFRFYHAGFNGSNILEPLYLVREDLNAIKRRTFRVRWNGLKTTYKGFRLLGYPAHWYIRPTLALVKVLVPDRLMLFYREIQKRKWERDNSSDFG